MQSNLLFIGNIGGWELVVVVMAILLLFGSKAIPDLARKAGTIIRQFNEAVDEIKRGIDEGTNDRSRS